MRASCGQEGEPGRCKQAASCRQVQQRYDKGRVKVAVQERYEAAACMWGMSEQQAGAIDRRDTMWGGETGRSIRGTTTRPQHPRIDMQAATSTD
ncbi:unnamed protein product [Calypogeia fissa]